MSKIFIMKHSAIAFVRYRIVILFALIGVTERGFSQTQATIQNSNPSDNQILNALDGGGMTMFLGPGDGLVRGVRNQQIAVFSGGDNAGLGMDEGVVFSTGNVVKELSQQNIETASSNWPQNSSTYNDPDLQGIFNGAINDVVVYKFKVTLSNYTSALRVVFQFGSEEYPDYVGSMFNDAFGFFVRPVSSGATLPGGASVINMARLPHSNNPISINTVNFGYAGDQGDTTYPGLDLGQSEHYINNGHTTVVAGNGRLVFNDNPGPKPVFVEYNGLTKLLTYDLTNLVPGQTYEFKIAIADSGDDTLDSGVIIKKIQGTTGADVKIVKTVDKMEPAIGSEVEFTLTASNLGPYDATNTNVSDLLPSGYTYLGHTASNGNSSYNSITGNWTIGNLEAIHQTETLKILALVKESGVHMNIATIGSDQLDPDYNNNMSSVNPVPFPPCIDKTIFSDDFGSSDKDINSGRAISPYVPAAGYSFGIPHPTSAIQAETSIGKGYYAVVAPGNVKYGWNPSYLSEYLWTPSYQEPGAITDVSGTTLGAAMAVNGGSKSNAFYQREASLEYGSIYRVALWIYVVNGPTQIAIDIKDKNSGAVYNTTLLPEFSTGNEGHWTSVELYFRLPERSVLRCNIDDVLISFRNNSFTQENNFYTDNISLIKLTSDSACIPASFINLKCPSRLIITNPMLPAKAK